MPKVLSLVRELLSNSGSRRQRIEDGGALRAEASRHKKQSKPGASIATRYSFDELKSYICNVDIPKSIGSVRAELTTVKLIGSYSWHKSETDPKPCIVIPACPPIWSPQPVSMMRGEGAQGIIRTDYNQSHSPHSPLAPLLHTVKVCRPDFDLASVAVITDSANLSKLFLYLRHPESCPPFRIYGEVVLNTLILTQWEPQSTPQPSCNMPFREEYARFQTKTAPGSHTPVGHYVIQCFESGKHKVVVRAEVDACTGVNACVSPLPRRIFGNTTNSQPPSPMQQAYHAGLDAIDSLEAENVPMSPFMPYRLAKRSPPALWEPILIGTSWLCVPGSRGRLGLDSAAHQLFAQVPYKDVAVIHPIRTQSGSYTVVAQKDSLPTSETLPDLGAALASIRPLLDEMRGVIEYESRTGHVAFVTNGNGGTMQAWDIGKRRMAKELRALVGKDKARGLWEDTA
ncbi:hypothetical protein BOTBODRAFT_185656 [Botryobasidium botryosum FD-172 SS1]|uniref:Uncharacterized protein n=1 Tax=Botryobasidium botryosum (strain FD-172 SS1) TaxID=930990 RepID=A0A067MRZ8_BOTB1|nr:hypothetical protein BOTBODRAFT_185656 [Botryobasidium botryosum FD-172 SS1]